MKRLNKKDYTAIVFGVFLVLVSLVIYLILGKNSIIFANDQLDGEVIAYILHAKYLFSGVKNYPEVMNGITSNGLFPPAPLAILLYYLMPPFYAFITNQIICMLIGFVGMYMCLRIISDNRIVCFFTGIIFAYLPLLSVYGLCQYGIPILIFAFYQIHKGINKVVSYLIIAFYAAMSSLVLTGYALLGFILLYMCYLIYRKQYKEFTAITIGWLIMLAIYVITDSSLLLQVFKIGKQVPSHKEDLVRNGQNCIKSFVTVFFNGTLHTPTHQQLIIIASAIFIVYTLIFKKRFYSAGHKTKIILFYVLFIFNFVCAVFYSLVQSQTVANLRNSAGGIIKDFQPDRIYWLSVPTWYFILGLILDVLIEEYKYWLINKKPALVFTTSFFMMLVTAGTSATVFYYSDINKNLHRIISGESYDKLTWEDFYSSDVFCEIDEFIGEDKSSFRTLSFGIHPAAAIYNGFYTLDAYSNNYDLNYKHQFRDIISGELDKDSILSDYFDNWGCRCYLLSSELGTNNFLIPKDSDIQQVNNLCIDTKAAAKMGAKYIFSAVRINNADEIGLTLMRDAPFSTATSYVQIYLYEIQG